MSLLPLAQLRSEAPMCIRHQEPASPRVSPAKLGPALRTMTVSLVSRGPRPPSQDSRALQVCRDTEGSASSPAL